MTHPYRPASPSTGPARWLRALAGIREDVLNWVPEDRPRYTRLGAIILNTGLLAGLSLFTGLDKVIRVHWLFLVPIALVWAFVVVSFDGWLIASTHGAVKSARWRVFIPRLVISVLMGAVIAEPLLLWTFQPAVRAEVLAHRQDELARYESRLKTCNPDSGEPVNTADCQDLKLRNPDSPHTKQVELTAVTAQRDRLRAQVDQLNERLGDMNELARAECNGRSGIGLSGQTGEGPDCKRDRLEADRYRSDGQLDQRQADLTALDRRVVALTAEVQAAGQRYAETVDAAIARQVATRADSQGTIGILDEDAALGRLSDRSGLVLGAQWLVRLLLIAIDCLPVLTKMMGGVTGYDRRVEAQRKAGEDLHGVFLELQGRRIADEFRANGARHAGVVGERRSPVRRRVRTTAG
ncbi:MAG: hypothetical protein AUI10_00530 [Actinobacteria bacterium 13_2_20CM_2_72_6]|nr:MAG: hypothetical protein AUI10_00530 [Actinobacteria bacterium 13_2_20CM_2_72_6]